MVVHSNRSCSFSRSCAATCLTDTLGTTVLEDVQGPSIESVPTARPTGTRSPPPPPRSSPMSVLSDGSGSASRPHSSAAWALLVLAVADPSTGYHGDRRVRRARRGRQRHGLRRLGGRLHRDRREARPGCDDDRPGDPGLDHPDLRRGVTRGAHLRRAGPLGPGRQELPGGGTRRRPPGRTPEALAADPTDVDAPAIAPECVVGQQWQTRWWVRVGGQVLLLPFVFVLAGRWNPCAPGRTSGSTGRWSPAS